MVWIMQHEEWIIKGDLCSWHCNVYSDTIIFSSFGEQDVDTGLKPTTLKEFKIMVNHLKRRTIFF